MIYKVTDPDANTFIGKVKADSFKEAAIEGMWMASGIYGDEHFGADLLVEDEHGNKKLFDCIMETNPIVSVEEITRDLSCD